MSKPKTRRRLCNIKTEEVSLVDMAANQRKFIVIKNQEGSALDPIEIMKAAFGPILQKIETALNTIIDNQTQLNKRLDALEPNAEELKKAGAKFSKETLAKLKSAGELIAGLMAGVEEPTQKNRQGADVEMTAEEVAASLKKGLLAGMSTEEKKPDDNAQIAAIVAGVMKAMQEQSK